MSQQKYPTLFKNPFFDNKTHGLTPQQSLAKRDYDEHQILNNDLFSQAIQTQNVNLIHQESAFDFEDWKDIYDLIKQNEEFPSKNTSLTQQQLSRVESFVKELQQNPFYDSNGLSSQPQSSDLKKLLQQNNIYQNDLFSQSVKSLARQGSSALNDRFRDLYNVQNEGNWLNDMTFSKEMKLNSNFFPKNNQKLSTIESQVQALQTQDSFADFITNLDQHNQESKQQAQLKARQRTIQELRLKERKLEELKRRQNAQNKDALTNILQGNPMSTMELLNSNNKEGDNIQTYQILNYSVNKIRSLLSMDHDDKLKRIESTNSVDSLEQDLRGKSSLYRSREELSSQGNNSHSHSQAGSFQKNSSFRQLNQFQDGYNSGNDSSKGRSQQMRFSQGMQLIDDLINENSLQNNSVDSKSQSKDSRSFRSQRTRSGITHKTGGSKVSPRRVSKDNERSQIPNELRQFSGGFTKRAQSMQPNLQGNQEGDLELDMAAQSDLLDTQESTQLVARSKSKPLQTQDLSTQNTRHKLYTKDDVDGSFPDEIQQLKMSLQKNKTSSFSSKNSNQKYKLDSNYRRGSGIQVQKSDLEQIQSGTYSDISTVDRETLRSYKKRNNPFQSPEKQGQGTSDDSREDLIFSINSANNKLRHSKSQREVVGLDQGPSYRGDQLNNYNDNKITYVGKQNKMNSYMNNKSRAPHIHQQQQYQQQQQQQQQYQQQEMEMELEIEPISQISHDRHQHSYMSVNDTQNTNENSVVSVDLPSYKNSPIAIKESPQRPNSFSGIRSKPSSNDVEIEIDFTGKKTVGEGGSHGSQVFSGSYSQTVSGSDVNSRSGLQTRNSRSGLQTRKKRQIQAKRSASQGLPLNTARIEMEINPLDPWGSQQNVNSRTDLPRTQNSSQSHNMPLGRRTGSQHGSFTSQDQLISNIDQENLIGAGRKVEHQKIKNRAREIKQHLDKQQDQQNEQNNNSNQQNIDFDDLDSELELEGQLLCLESEESQQKLAKEKVKQKEQQKQQGIKPYGDRVSKRALEELKRSQRQSQSFDKFNTIKDYLNSYEEDTIEQVATKFSSLDMQGNKSVKSSTDRNISGLGQNRSQKIQAGRRKSTGGIQMIMQQNQDNYQIKDQYQNQQQSQQQNQQQDQQQNEFIDVTGSDLDAEVEMQPNSQQQNTQDQKYEGRNQYSGMVRKPSSISSKSNEDHSFNDTGQSQQQLQRQNTDFVLGNQAKRKMLTTNNQNKIHLAQQQGGHGLTPFHSEIDFRTTRGVSVSSQQQDHFQMHALSQKVDNVDNSQSVPMTVSSTPLNSGRYHGVTQQGITQQKRPVDYAHRSPSDSSSISPVKDIKPSLSDLGQKTMDKLQNPEGGMQGFPVNPVYEFDFAYNAKDYVVLPERQQQNKDQFKQDAGILPQKSDQNEHYDYNTKYSEADSSGLKNQIRQRSYIYQKQHNLTQIEEASYSSNPSGVNNLKNQFDFLNTDETENTLNLDFSNRNQNSAENSRDMQIEVQKQTPQVIFYNQQNQNKAQPGMSKDIKRSMTQETDLSKQMQSIGRPGPSNHSPLEKVVTFDKLMEGYETNQQVQSLNDSFSAAVKDQLAKQDEMQEEQDSKQGENSKEQDNALSDSKKSINKLEDQKKKGGIERKGSGDSNGSVDLNDIYLVLRKFKKELVSKKGDLEENKEKDPDRSGKELDRIKRLINDIEGKASKLDTQQVLVKEKKKKKKDKEKREKEKEKEKQKKEKERKKSGKKKNRESKDFKENDDNDLNVKIKPVDESILDDHDYQDMQRQRKSIKNDLVQLQGYMDVAIKSTISPDISGRSHNRSFRSFPSGLSHYSNHQDPDNSMRQTSLKVSLAQQIHQLSSSIDNVTQQNVAATRIESLQRQEQYRLQYIREQQIREQQFRAQQLREQQIREQQLREQQIRDQVIRERQIREQQIREQQIREQQIREQQLRDQQLRELQIREREMDLTLRELQHNNFTPPPFRGQGPGQGYQAPPLPQSTPYLQQVQNLPPQMQGLYNPQQSFVGVSQAPPRSFVGGMNQGPRSFIGGPNPRPAGPPGGGPMRPGPSMGPMQGRMGQPPPPMQYSGMQMRPGMMQPGVQQSGYFNY